MRLLARSVHRAFPELDAFSDAECRIYVRNATASPLRRAARIAVNIAVLAGLVALEVHLLRPWITSLYLPERMPALLLLVLCTVGIGALVMRDLLLRLAIRRIMGRGARCPQCSYSLAGLPVSQGQAVTCPECARTTDVSVHASHFARGADGLLRFLPGPEAQVPVDPWLTARRVRAVARWTAVAAAAVSVALAIPMTIWEVHLRRMASAANAAAASLPSAAALLEAAMPAAAKEPGDSAFDALSEFHARCGSLQGSVLLHEISDWPQIWWFGSSRVAEQGQAELPLAMRTRLAARLVPEARNAGLIESLERLGRAAAIRLPVDPAAGSTLWACMKARMDALPDAIHRASNMASLWMLDACARGEPVEAARAFRTILALSSINGMLRPFPFSGSVVGAAQLLEHLAAVSRLQGGDEALRVARQGFDRNLRCRFAPESIAALETRMFQEQVIRTFGDPAVLRWRVFPWIRTQAYESAIGHRWGRGAPVTQDPSALAFDFDREWAASLELLPAELLSYARSVPWDAPAQASVATGVPLPPMAASAVAWLPRWTPGREPAQLADFAVACVLGIEEFRRANDRLPAALGELVPAYLPALPPRALGVVYRLVRDPACPLGYQLYSMGFDGTDDGCSAERDYPIVGSPVASPGDGGASGDASSSPGGVETPN